MSQIGAIVRNGVSGFFDWWLGELAGMVPRALNPARRRRRRLLILTLGHDRVSLSRGGDGDGQPLGEVPSDDPAALGALVRRARGRKRHATVRLAPGQGLRKAIELPLAAKEDLDQLLRFEMDRLTPFRAVEVAFAHRVIATDPRARRMQVELQLAPRAVVEGALGRAREAGLVPVRVEMAGLAGGLDAALDLSPHDHPSGRGGPSRLNRVLAVLAVLLGAAAVGIPLQERYSTAAALQAEAAAARVEAEASLALRTELEEVSASTDLLALQKFKVPMVSRILAEVTSAVPDQAYLARLDWRDGTLQLEGYADGAAALIGQLDASPLFQTPQFRSPVTPDRATGLERFHLSIELATEEDR